MKFRKLFLLSLPLSLLGLKKVAEHCHGCGHQRHSGHWSHRRHIMKFIAWRIGLSPAQKMKIEELHTRMKTQLKPFSEKHDEVRTIIMKEFRKEHFETEQLSGRFTPELLEQTHDTFLKSVGELHDILTPVQRDKLATLFERHHCQ